MPIRPSIEGCVPNVKGTMEDSYAACYHTKGLREIDTAENLSVGRVHFEMFRESRDNIDKRPLSYLHAGLCFNTENEKKIINYMHDLEIYAKSKKCYTDEELQDLINKK